MIEVLAKVNRSYPLSSFSTEDIWSPEWDLTLEALTDVLFEWVDAGVLGEFEGLPRSSACFYVLHCLDSNGENITVASLYLEGN